MAGNRGLRLAGNGRSLLAGSEKVPHRAHQVVEGGHREMPDRLKGASIQDRLGQDRR